MVKKEVKKNYRKKVTPKKSMMKPNIRKVVKKLIKDELEVKNYVTSAQQPCTITGAGAIATPLGGNELDLSPYINQGFEQGEHLGNKVTVSSVKVRYTLSYIYTSSEQAIFVPCYVDVILYRTKYGIAPPILADWQGVLDEGNTSAYYDSSTAMSLNTPINRDLFTIYYRKRIKMGLATSPQQNLNNGTSNNDFSLCRFETVDLSRFFRGRTVSFDDDNVPNNCPLFATAFIVPMPVGNIGVGANAVYPTIHVKSQWFYTDA